jgi:hypothetical protein
LYFRQGVRRIDEETFARILAAAAAGDPTAGRRRHEAGLPWAPPEVARLVDDVATALATAHLRALHPAGQVQVMPHNNPGYDIRVEFPGAPERYIEVKGTTRHLPHFFMSEGERLFSQRHGDAYTLVLVYDIDRTARTGKVLTREGPVAGDDLSLQAVQWEGALADPSAAGVL